MIICMQFRQNLRCRVLWLGRSVMECPLSLYHSNWRGLYAADLSRIPTCETNCLSLCCACVCVLPILHVHTVPTEHRTSLWWYALFMFMFIETILEVGFRVSRQLTTWLKNAAVHITVSHANACTVKYRVPTSAKMQTQLRFHDTMYLKGLTQLWKSRRIYPKYRSKCSVGSTDHVCKFLLKNFA